MRAFFLTLLLVWQIQASDFTFTWYGTTCLSLSDGQTTLLFDPYFNRPSLWDMVTFKKLTPAKSYVKKWLHQSKHPSIDATFISHTHVDHVLDLPNIYALTKSKIYGSPSAKNIALAARIPKQDIHVIAKNQKIQLGKFKVTVIEGYHASHALGLTIAHGAIDKNFSLPASAYDYKMGKPYSFLIEHPKKTIFFNSSYTNPLRHMKKEVDIIFQSIIKRKSTLKLIEEVLLPLKAKHIVPIHHDNFFKPLHAGLHYFPILTKYDEFTRILSQEPKINLITPHYGRTQALP